MATSKVHMPLRKLQRSWLALRAAAVEHRLAALIAYDGGYRTRTRATPKENVAITAAMAHDTGRPSH